MSFEDYLKTGKRLSSEDLDAAGPDSQLMQAVSYLTVKCAAAAIVSINRTSTMATAWSSLHAKTKEKLLEAFTPAQLVYIMTGGASAGRALLTGTDQLDESGRGPSCLTATAGLICASPFIGVCAKANENDHKACKGCITICHQRKLDDTDYETCRVTVEDIRSAFTATPELPKQEEPVETANEEKSGSPDNGNKMRVWGNAC